MSETTPWETIKTDNGTEIRIVQLADPGDEERNCLVWQGGLLLAADIVYGAAKRAAWEMDGEAYHLLWRVHRRLLASIDREQAIFNALVGPGGTS